MNRYTDTARATAPISMAEEHSDPRPLPSTRPHHYRATGRSMRDAAGAVVAARFALYAMAQEALDEGRLWFSEEDLICMHAIAGHDVRGNVVPEQGGYLVMRARDPNEARRAADIMLGRGAARVDVLSPDCALHGSLTRAFARRKKTPGNDR